MSSNSSAGSKVFVAVVVILFVVLLLALAWKLWHMRSSMSMSMGSMASMDAPAVSTSLSVPGLTLTTKPGGQTLATEVDAMSAGSPMEYYGQLPHYHQWDEPWAPTSAGAPAQLPHPTPLPTPHYHPAIPAASSGEGRFVTQPSYPQPQPSYPQPQAVYPQAQYAGAHDVDFGETPHSHMQHYDHAPMPPMPIPAPMQRFTRPMH